MAEQSMILDFAFGANSPISEKAKNAIKTAINSQRFKAYLSAKISGMQFSLVGNLDKGVIVLIAWKGSTPYTVEKAVFESVTDVCWESLVALQLV